MRHKALAVAISSALIALTVTWAALAGFPASGQIFPAGGAGPPPPSGVIVLRYCRPTFAFANSPCTAVAAAPTTGGAAIPNNTTYVTKLNQAQFPATLTAPNGKVLVALNNPSSTNSYIVDAIWLGPGNTVGTPACGTGISSACNWNFDPTPAAVQLKCNGNASFTITSTSTGQATCGGTDTSAGITYLDAANYIIPTDHALTISADVEINGRLVTIAPSATNIYVGSKASANFQGWTGNNASLTPGGTNSYASGTGILTMNWLTTVNPPLGPVSATSIYSGLPCILTGFTPTTYNTTVSNPCTINSISTTGRTVTVKINTGLAALTTAGKFIFPQAALNLKASNFAVQSSPILPFLARVDTQ